MKDLDGRYILGNRQWEVLTGLQIENALGHTDFELFPLESAEEWVAHDRAVLASGVPAITDEVLNRDGKTVYFLSSKFPFLDVNGEPFALCGMTLDVTETKRAEEALREREAEFRTLIDNIPGVVFRCEVGDDGAMYFVSDEMERLTGYPAAEFMGEGVFLTFS
jgi:PAS domain S-box-containing protein